RRFPTMITGNSIWCVSTQITLIAAGLLIAAGARQAIADDKAKDDEKILGAWTVVSFEEGGQKAPEAALRDMTVTFTADGKMTTKRGEQEEVSTFKLDPSKKIKEFEGTNAQGKTADGIYKLEGDSLTICFARAAGSRPTEFASPEGTKIVLTVLKRVPK